MAPKRKHAPFQKEHVLVNGVLKPKFWTHLFRTDNYKKHHNAQHPEKQAIIRRVAFFIYSADAKVSRVLARPGNHRNDHSAAVLHLDDSDGATHERAIVLFKRNTATSEVVGSSNGVS
eukprot:IDg13960t1